MKVLLCPLSDGGFLYPTIAVGRELEFRGHQVAVLGRSGIEPLVAGAGLSFLAAESFGGRRAFSAAWWGRTGLEQYRATARAAREFGADLLVTSVLCNGALLAAEALDIPAVVVGLSVHLWEYAAGGEGEPPLGRSRGNRTEEMRRLYERVREEAGFPAGGSRWGSGPLLGDALLLRGDPVLEFPGARLPERVWHVGPLAWEPVADTAEVEEVREFLARSGKPVVYVHLGRVFEGASRWPHLNEAFTGGRFQAVVEQGRSPHPEPAPGADILAVRKPWMGPLIDMAGLVVTSGTSAPVLGALIRGRALGASPNGSEQPLLTWACMRAGVAVHLPKDSPGLWPELLEETWRDEGLRSRAGELGDRLAAVDGAGRAADIVEAVPRRSGVSKEEHDEAITRP
ncbi:glycosyltransferase [Streptomyces sp. ZL-24]|nr:glycosyltransferase [Streptomyces sp. ZL-24]